MTKRSLRSRRQSMRASRSKRCRYGVKKSGGCKKKPGVKKGSHKRSMRSHHKRSMRSHRKRSTRSHRKRSTRASRSKRCRYGVKKSGGCKKKPGVKKGSHKTKPVHSFDSHSSM